MSSVNPPTNPANQPANPANQPQPIPSSWLCVSKFNQVSTTTVAMLNAVVGIILVLVAALNTDPAIQRLIGLGFGTAIALLNIVLHWILQLLIITNSSSNAQEQQEESYIDDNPAPNPTAIPIPTNTAAEV